MRLAAGRERELEAKREKLRRGYLSAWARMISEWRAPRRGDAAWLVYAGSYLLNTGGVKWAVDPVTLSKRVAGAPQVPATQDLSRLSFSLLTHTHSDHVDEPLWRELSATSSMRWIVPLHMLEWFQERAQARESRVIPATEGRPIEIDGLRILPFRSLHFAFSRDGERTGVDETGYAVDTPCGRYLFPGDVRAYDASRLPDFGEVTAVFAHVFLGRSEALEPRPSLLDDFIEFHLSFRPRKVILTHLDELGRRAEDCWVREHAEMTRREIHARDANVEVVIPEWFAEIALAS